MIQISKFAGRSKSAAEAVQQLLRTGHVLRLHSSNGRLGAKGMGAWKDFAKDYLSCVLSRPATLRDLTQIGFLIGVPEHNIQLINEAIQDTHIKYRHFEKTAPEPKTFNGLTSYINAHLDYYNSWKRAIGNESIFILIDPDDPDPITDEDDIYWDKMGKYSDKLPLVLTALPPLDGQPLTRKEELGIIDILLASIDYPLQAEAEGHEQFGRGILRHTGLLTENTSISTMSNIGSMSLDAIDKAIEQNRLSGFAAVISRTLKQNIRIFPHLGTPEMEIQRLCRQLDLFRLNQTGPHLP